MASYKEASERMNRTGNGLEGFQFTSFQEYVVRNVCRYYFDLEPILKDRPNVTPWFTNEDDSDDETEDTTERDHDRNVRAVILSSDDESASSLTECSNKTRDVVSNEETSEERSRSATTTTSEVGRQSTAGSKYDGEYSSDSDHTLSTTNNTSNVSNMSDDTSSINIGSRQLKKKDKVIKSPKRKSTKQNSNKYTPMEAKKMQKTLLLKNRKKSIVKKNDKHRSSTYANLDNDERDLLVETRKSKMIFEKEKHMDMKRLENEKMNIERERLNMEKDTIKLRHEHMMTQNNLERSKIALLRLEMFKERQEIKKKYPEVTEEMLNEQFPYPN